MAALRIFSYLPNPRVWKAQIAGDICGVEVEVLGDGNLGSWLWDFDARPMDESERSETSPHARISRRGFSGTLFKTDAFMQAHPFGTVPAAFSPDGQLGIFESNSILRAVVRAASDDHGLYGRDGYHASRIDSFLDAALVLGREAQVYLLNMMEMTPDLQQRMAGAFEFYMNGIENALASSTFIAGDEMTIADIGFVCDVGQFLREGKGRFRTALTERGLAPLGDGAPGAYPHAVAHLKKLGADPVFRHRMGNYLEWYFEAAA